MKIEKIDDDNYEINGDVYVRKYTNKHVKEFAVGGTSMCKFIQDKNSDCFLYFKDRGANDYNLAFGASSFGFKSFCRELENIVAEVWGDVKYE